MATPLEINIGHNRFDPIGQYFAEAAADLTPDPTVKARCPAALQGVVDMMNKIEGSKIFDMDDPSGLHCITPGIKYSAVNGASGSVLLQTYYASRSKRAAAAKTRTVAACALVARPEGRPDWGVTIMQLDRQSIWQRSNDRMRRGGHAELNYFLLVTRKIGESAAKARIVASSEE
jgi:hypothetical protein